ncbi:MAG: mechanosensitive ion channel family protein [Anaerolineae bacterium]|nr:mechanosensitive ion channel family protein [Anaerolineae bacterium]
MRALDIAGIPLVEWLLALALWAGLTVLLVTLRRALTSQSITTLLEASRFGAGVRFVVQRLRFYTLVALALYFVAQVFALPANVRLWVERLVFVAVLLQAAEWASVGVGIYLERYRRQRLSEDASAVTAIQALGLLVRAALWTLALLVALENLGINVSALIASVGLASIAIGLAVQNILGDLFAALSIVVDKPFVVGDFIMVDNFMGTVERIGLKSTRVRSLTGEQLVFSNSDLLRSRLRNFKDLQERRAVLNVGVVYQTPLECLQRIPLILREVIERTPGVRFERAHFKEFGPSALIFEAVYWVQTPDFVAYMDAQQAVNLALLERFNAEGIAFAYPTQTLFVYEATAPRSVK